MKSIQTKFILLIVVAVVLTELLTSAIGSYSYSNAMKDDSNRILQLTAEEKSEELNSILGRIEQSVDVMVEHSLDRLESVDKLKNDPEYLEEYTGDIEHLGITTANRTSGVIGVYIRYNPDILPADAGFFRLRPLGEETFQSIEVTDFSEYDMSSTEQLDWYTLPMENGKPTWILPFYDKNIDGYMISYVVPLYKNGEEVGIIGMDIDYTYLTQLVDEITLYDTGHAFLTNSEHEVLHSKHSENGVGEEATEEKVVYKELLNGMCLGVAVPIGEVLRGVNYMMLDILLASIAAIGVAVCVTVLVAKSITKPLKQLGQSAIAVAEGNLDVEFVCDSEDEVGVLAQTLRETAKELKNRIEFINDLAYVDELTGVKNRTAYAQELMRRKEMDNEKCAVFVIDLNGLKHINDVYGHLCGNELIVKISKIITSVFGYENTYRIGGDEFVVVMSVENDIEVDKLEVQFKDKLKSQEGNIYAEAAIGAAVGKTKEAYDDIFKRADSQMYDHKQKMKERGENSKVLS